MRSRLKKKKRISKEEPSKIKLKKKHQKNPKPAQANFTNLHSK
jgi:hypothetical protein